MVSHEMQLPNLAGGSGPSVQTVGKCCAGTMACSSGEKSGFIFLSFCIIGLFVFRFEAFLKVCYMKEGRMCVA